MNTRLPNGWQKSELQELVSNPIADIVDGPFGSELKAAEYIDMGVPIIRLQNVGRGSFLSKNLRYISLEKAEYLARHGYQPGDIVITKLGDPLGQCR